LILLHHHLVLKQHLFKVTGKRLIDII